MTTIYYVSAPAGSGKTFGLSHHAVDLAKKHEKLIIAQPTHKLIQQTKRQIAQIDSTIQVATIYGQHALSKIEAHIASATPHHGEVLIITHEALKRLSSNNRRHWHLVVDEVPAVFVHMPYQIARTHHIVTDYIIATEELFEGSGVNVVNVGNPTKVEELIINETEDQNIAAFSPLMNAIQDDHKLVCVGADSYADLLSNPSTHGHIDFFSILLPSFVAGFKSTTFMAANFRDTELYILWQTILDVEWLEHPSIGQYLLYQTHQNGNRLTINYLIDRNWSLNHAGRGDGDETNLTRAAAFIEQYLNGREYLWHANTDADRELFQSRYRLDSVIHGIDREDYRGIHNVVLISALNHRTPAYKFLSLLGISSERAQQMLAYQTEYQTLMRCSLRDPKAVQPVTVVVMSRGSAEWLQNLFSGSTVQKLDSPIAEPRGVGRPKKEKPLTGAERKAKSVAKKKAAQAAMDARLLALSEAQSHSE